MLPSPTPGPRRRPVSLPGSPLRGAILGLVLLTGCAAPISNQRTLVVTATAYNSFPGQTQGDPSVGAWGDTLRPEVPSIAVSRDLIGLGLGRGARVRIEGFARDYYVLDKMPPKWKKRIDIHMGTDRRAALDWGQREVRISWSSDR